MSPIKALITLLASRVGEIAAAAAGAALLAYLQTQSSDGIKWFFDPIVRSLPWRRAARPQLPRQSLASELTLSDIFLMTSDGKHAIYAKTGSYVVGTEPLSSYYEGITASGIVSNFSTELGAIVSTTIEHGFHISQIDLGSVLELGTRFRNVYRAQLDGCFTNREEHWTQEIAIPTKHLTLRVHFPADRPPLLIRCKRISGLSEYQTATRATISLLFGQPAIIWEIEEPKVGDIFKLEWRW